MESLLEYVCANADSAHWILFAIIMIAGLNVPISEDLVLITGGALASTCLEGAWMNMYLWLFFAAWWSAWEAYWVGRLLGPKLYDIRWFSRFLTPQKIEKLHHYYEKFGIYTFIIGRFIPGGVRNALFMSAGLGKMPFLTFILRDIPGCFLSTAFLFWVGYAFGEHYDAMVGTIHAIDKIAIVAIVVVILGAIFYFRFRKKE